MPDPTSAPDQANLTVGLPLVSDEPTTRVLVGAVAVGATVSGTTVTGTVVSRRIVSLTGPLQLPARSRHLAKTVLSPSPDTRTQIWLAAYDRVVQAAPSFESATSLTPDVASLA